MSHRNFRDLMEARNAAGFFVCVGIDPDLALLPASIVQLATDQTLLTFVRNIVTATAAYAACFKFNSAFFEAYGAEGMSALQEAIRFAQGHAPEVPIILDCKRGDIGNTNGMYVRFAFEYCRADAVTVQPYLGKEALEPFLKQADKGIFVLCRTSNTGAGEFQDLRLHHGHGDPLYLQVARNVFHDWNTLGNCGLVVGATAPDMLKLVRQAVGDMPLLIPGIGKQGGDLEASVRNGRNSAGRGFIINASSSIIYASKGADFASKARDAALKLHEQITACLKQGSAT